MAHKHPPATKKSPDELKPGYYNVHWNTQLPGVINGTIKQILSDAVSALDSMTDERFAEIEKEILAETTRTASARETVRQPFSGR